MEVYTKDNRDDDFGIKDLIVTSTEDHDVVIQVKDYHKGIERMRFDDLRPVLEIRLYEHEAEKLYKEIFYLIEHAKRNKNKKP